MVCSNCTCKYGVISCDKYAKAWVLHGRAGWLWTGHTYYFDKKRVYLKGFGLNLGRVRVRFSFKLWSGPVTNFADDVKRVSDLVVSWHGHLESIGESCLEDR